MMEKKKIVGVGMKLNHKIILNSEEIGDKRMNITEVPVENVNLKINRFTC